MKKKYLLGALSVFLLASCSNDEVTEINQGEAIQFTASAGKAARSVITTTASINNFKVWAYTGDQTYMDGVEVTKTGDNWSYGNLKYWPQEAAVDFYSVNPTTYTVDADKKIVDFAVADEVANQIDLLYAANIGETKAAHKNTPVAVNFRHALSQIVFKAKVKEGSNLKVKIDGVRIAQLEWKGTLTYPTATTAADAADVANTWGTWANTRTAEENKKFYAAGITSQTITAGQTVALTTENSGELLLMPQTLSPWTVGTDNTENKSYFLVDCQIWDGDVQLWPVENTTAEVAIPVSEITWAQGKKYIYTFIFGEGGGYVPPTDPDDPTPDPDSPKPDSDKPQPGDPDKPQPGDPVLVGINFTVTVDDFVLGNEIDVNMK